MPRCANCLDEGWVCENHEHVPWRCGAATCCAADPPDNNPQWTEWGCGAGMPCAECNEGLALGPYHGFETVIASADDEQIPPEKRVH